MKSKEHRLRPGQAAAIMLAAGAALLLLTAKHLMSFRAKTAEQKEQNPVEDASGEIRERAGMIGRLVIPDVGVDAALFESSADAASRQKVVDAMDSALYIPGTDGERDIIADHARQGFVQMEKAVPGKTLLYINASPARWGAEPTRDRTFWERMGNPFLCRRTGTSFSTPATVSGRA